MEEILDIQQIRLGFWSSPDHAISEYDVNELTKLQQQYGSEYSKITVAPYPATKITKEL